jgi:hypothetical protein
MTRKGILALATMLFVLLREQMIAEVQSADFADGHIEGPDFNSWKILPVCP